MSIEVNNVVFTKNEKEEDLILCRGKVKHLFIADNPEYGHLEKSERMPFLKPYVITIVGVNETKIVEKDYVLYGHAKIKEIMSFNTEKDGNDVTFMHLSTDKLVPERGTTAKFNGKIIAFPWQINNKHLEELNDGEFVWVECNNTEGKKFIHLNGDRTIVESEQTYKIQHDHAGNVKLYKVPHKNWNTRSNRTLELENIEQIIYKYQSDNAIKILREIFDENPVRNVREI